MLLLLLLVFGLRVFSGVGEVDGRVFVVCFFKMLVAAAVVALSPRYQSSRLQPGAEQSSPEVIAGETLQGRDHVRM